MQITVKWIIKWTYATLWFLSPPTKNNANHSKVTFWSDLFFVAAHKNQCKSLHSWRPGQADPIRPDPAATLPAPTCPAEQGLAEQQPELPDPSRLLLLPQNKRICHLYSLFVCTCECVCVCSVWCQMPNHDGGIKVNQIRNQSDQTDS